MTAPTPTRRLAIGLALSLLLNVFLIGFMSARVLGRRGRDAHAAAGHKGHAAREAQAPPLDGQRLLRAVRGLELDADARAVVANSRNRMRPQREALRATRAAVGRALTAEPFDADALSRAFEAQRAAHAEAQRTAHTTLAELARRLPADKRSQLLQASQRRRERREGGLNRPRGRPRPPDPAPQ